MRRADQLEEALAEFQEARALCRKQLLDLIFRQLRGWGFGGGGGRRRSHERALRLVEMSLTDASITLFRLGKASRIDDPPS